MRTSHLIAAASCAVLAASSASFAAPQFVEGFDSPASAANWTVNQTTGTHVAAFGYDYSLVGIPAAPNTPVGGGTTGLKLQPNVGPTAGTGVPGLSVSPTGKSFAGNYKLTADVWMNYQFTGATPNVSGSGTTQFAGIGLLTAGTSAQTPGVADGIYAGTTLDGGSATDYRVYAPGATAGYADASPVFAAGAVAGNRNSSASYYTTAYPTGAYPVPAAQVALYPTQTGGASAAGTPSFSWHAWSMTKTGNTIVYAIDGLTIATVDASAITTAGSNFLLMASDTNTTVSTDATAAPLLFALFDNITVVPEPTSLAALGLASTLLRRRRR
jgi:hypothetical protein